MGSVSRDIMRAVLETRDNRHNETHAILLGLFQSLVAELVEQGSLRPGPLAERLALTESQVANDPNGGIARDMMSHVLSWLGTLDPNLPPPHPARWHAPARLPEAPQG